MDKENFTTSDAIAFRKKFKATLVQVARWFHATPSEIEGYESGTAIPKIMIKRYQMFEHTGNETPEDFEEIGDFGKVD